ncbi:hypothetical protein B0H11DRAFT_2032360 [Mycena galericulata]|nr:hypothetical protein B0H11DRAFT_2032360 [Mycena galericulata]
MFKDRLSTSPNPFELFSFPHTPDIGSHISDMSNFYSPTPAPAAAPVPSDVPVTHTIGTLKGQEKEELSTDLETDSESSDSEMSDEIPRRLGRNKTLRACDTALIRFLINHKVDPREIRAHPECRWVVETVNKYKVRSDKDDAQYVTPDFRRILTEIRETRKTKGHGKPKRRGKAKPVNVGRRTGKGPHTRASTKLTDDTKLVSAGAGSASKSISLHRSTDTDHFLRAFVGNAHLDDDCYDILKNAGFTKAEKLRDIADLGKAEVEKFVAAELPAMTPVDRALLVKAFVSLASQV